MITRQDLTRLGRFVLVRALWVGMAVVVAAYLTIIIANMGGALDEMRKDEIRAEVAMSVVMNPANKGLPPSVLQEMIEATAQRKIALLGLDKPFFPKRSFQYLWDALSLKLGWAEQMTSDAGSRQVRFIILERLPTTLLLFGTANLLLFFLSLFVALFLSRRYGSFLDKAVIALAPSSAAPGWFYGLFLILIFAALLKVLPWGGLVGVPVPENRWLYALSVGKHMLLPTVAVVLSSLFASIYSWRTLFLIYSSEDYVELARAKGLSSRGIEMRYVLRPTLPPILTSFLLVLITMWMGQIVLETVFQWPGLGRTFYEAVGRTDTPVIIGITVIYGYLLAATVFVLDFIYAILDPRVRVGAEAKA
jgi:peptide/nickel transport system permease protein